VLGLIARARRVQIAVRGWVAEENLRATPAATPGVSECERLDTEGSPDIRPRYRDGPFLSVACKTCSGFPTARAGHGSIFSARAHRTGLMLLTTLAGNDKRRGKNRIVMRLEGDDHAI
jgi:hypothetical protein